MNLILVARSINACRISQTLFRSYGVRCVALKCDLAGRTRYRDHDRVRALEFKIDLWSNNAGLGLTGAFCRTTLLKSLPASRSCADPVGLSHALGTKMVACRKGGIINLASNAAFSRFPYGNLRGAKAFVFISASAKYSNQRARRSVMAVCPGPTRD